MRRCTALLSGLLAFGFASEASAEESIEWRWRRFQAWEYAATAGALAGGFYLRFGAPSPGGDWRGGILFDDWVRDRTAVENVQNRRTVVGISDAFYLGSMGYRLVDAVFVPGVGWGNWDTALQLAMIDLEAFGFTAITLWGLQAMFGRERPYVERCPGYSEESCDPDSPERNRSFYAGHPAVAMTAAALTCTHHAHLPLYGGGAGDTLACGVMLGAAALTGYGRAVTEMHYASDVFVGLGVGAFAGFALPELLHYAHERPKLQKADRGRLAPRVMAAPMLGDGQLGLGVVGLF
jgi:membrane-associated phospholipid phosphatase